MTDVALLVEGNLDAQVCGRLLAHVGLREGTVYGRRGWTYIAEHVRAFNTAAPHRPMFAMVDMMDTGLGCPPRVVTTWLPHRHTNMLLRIATPEVESWLLADRAGFSKFLGIRKQFLPTLPDTLADAKAELMRLAARSRRRARRLAIVPANGYSASEGPLYNTEVGIFVRESWNIDAAMDCSPSLRSAVNRLAELRARLEP